MLNPPLRSKDASLVVQLYTGVKSDTDVDVRDVRVGISYSCEVKISCGGVTEISNPGVLLDFR